MTTNTGKIELHAKLDKIGVPSSQYGSEHLNIYRGLDDRALAYFDAAATRVASHLKDTGGPYIVTLRSVVTRSNGVVTDSGTHVFNGVSSQAKDKMNREILDVGTELHALAKAKG